MKRILVMFLLSVAFASADIVCYVGGSSGSNTNGGWALSTVAAADAVGANGAAKYDAVGADPSESVAPAGTKLTKAGEFAASLADIYAYCDATGDMADNHYKILASDADSVTIDLAWNALYDNDTVDVYVGGSLAETDQGLDDGLNHTMSSAAAQNVTVKVYDSTGTIPISTSHVFANGGTAPYVLKVQGCDSSWVPLAVGSYINLDADLTNLDAAIFSITDLSNIWIEGLGFLHNDSGAGDAPGAAEHGIYINRTAGSPSGHVIRNCYFTDCYYGLYIFSTSVIDPYIQQCVFTTMANSCIYQNATRGEVAFCILDGSNYAGPVTNRGYNYHDNYVLGGTYAFSATLVLSIKNNSCYGQTVAGVYLNGTGYNSIILNNIFFVADPAADYAIQRNAGMYYEDYNITNADTAALSGFQAPFTGGHSYYDLPFDEALGRPFTDGSAGNLTLNTADAVIAIPYCIDKGIPTIGATISTGNGYTTIGAYQLTQTQSGVSPSLGARLPGEL